MPAFFMHLKSILSFTTFFLNRSANAPFISYLECMNHFIDYNLTFVPAI